MTVAAVPRPRLGPPPAPRVPEPERWTLANGLRVVFAPSYRIPHLAMRLILPAGSAADPAEHPGTASLVGSLLTEGTAQRDADALHARLDALGASLDTGVGHDFATVSATLLSETVAEGVELLAEIVTAPCFPQDETERVRAETLDALEARGDEPANVADDLASERVFGAHHPYGRPPWGTTDGVAGVTRGALRGFHTARYRPAGAILVAAGDPGDAELRDGLEDAFAGWAGEPEPLRLPDRRSEVGGGATVVWPDAAQSELRVVGPGLARSSAEWIPAAVANYLVGGSPITGRLGANLRERRGWTYGATSAFAGGLHAGSWQAHSAVGVEVTDAALEQIRLELRRICDEPVPDDELRSAQDAIILSLPRAFETPTRVASRLATVEAFGLERDYWERLPERVRAVTAEDVLRLARRFFAPERLAEIVVGGAGQASSSAAASSSHPGAGLRLRRGRAR